MKDSKEKTNVMRVLDQKKVPYNIYHYESEGALSGVEVSKAINMPVEKIFKTLVTVVGPVYVKQSSLKRNAKTEKNFAFAA